MKKFNKMVNFQLGKKVSWGFKKVANTVKRVVKK